tara:strand:- start:39332 stop:39643 length:312 start_codon:yes stop_codon:yes gene_type:complete
MILYIILTFSILINAILGWYTYKLLRNLISLEDTFLDMKTKLLEFATHLRAINKVESFYGDPTITALVEHMKRLAGEIENYSQVMVVFEDDLQEDTDDEQEED